MAATALEPEIFLPPSLQLGRIQVITGDESYDFIDIIRTSILPRIFEKADLALLNGSSLRDFGNLIAARNKLMRTHHLFGPQPGCRNMLMLFEATRLAPPEAMELLLSGATVGLFSVQASQSSSTNTLLAHEADDKGHNHDQPISRSKAVATFHALIYTQDGRYEITVVDITAEFLNPSSITITWQGTQDTEVQDLEPPTLPMVFMTDCGRGYQGD